MAVYLFLVIVAIGVLTIALAMLLSRQPPADVAVPDVPGPSVIVTAPARRPLFVGLGCLIPLLYVVVFWVAVVPLIEPDGDGARGEGAGLVFIPGMLVIALAPTVLLLRLGLGYRLRKPVYALFGILLPYVVILVLMLLLWMLVYLGLMLRLELVFTFLSPLLWILIPFLWLGVPAASVALEVAATVRPPVPLASASDG